MNDSLRRHFDRALSEESLPLPGDLAQEAMASGRRLRRRRRVMGGGAAAVVIAFATVIAVNVGQDPPPTTMSLAMRQTCTQREMTANSVIVFLRYDITDQQLEALSTALKSDKRLRSLEYDSKADAYANFRKMFRNEPELLEHAKVDQFPASFFARLDRQEQYRSFVKETEGRPGVERVVGPECRNGSSGEAK